MYGERVSATNSRKPSSAKTNASVEATTTDKTRNIQRRPDKFRRPTASDRDFEELEDTLLIVLRDPVLA
jgi:hypothetical protein